MAVLMGKELLLLSRSRLVCLPACVCVCMCTVVYVWRDNVENARTGSQTGNASSNKSRFLVWRGHDEISPPLSRFFPSYFFSPLLSFSSSFCYRLAAAWLEVGGWMYGMDRASERKDRVLVVQRQRGLNTTLLLLVLLYYTPHCHPVRHTSSANDIYIF